MTSESIRNGCSNAWDYVSNNPGRIVAGSIAAISLAPALYNVVPWAASGIASGAANMGSGIASGAVGAVGVISYVAKVLSGETLWES